jgi:ankyrin repeat protein
MNVNNDSFNSQCMISAEPESNYSLKTIVKKKIQQDPSLSEKNIKVTLFRNKFSFFNIPPKGNCVYTNTSISLKKYNTPAEFDESMRWMESYDSNKYNTNLINIYHHALMSATRNENIPLIKHICKLGGFFLFQIGSQDKTPLHIATVGIAKELLQLGCPVNIIKNTPDMFDETNETPLDHAIQNNEMQKATLLIRNDGISISPKTDIRILNEAVMTKSEKVFKLCIETKATIDIPGEILNHILMLSYKLDRVVL